MGAGKIKISTEVVTKPKRTYQRYSEAQKRLAVTVAAETSGHTEGAALARRILEQDHGLKIPEATLRAWLNEHPDWFTQAREDFLPRMYSELSSQYERIARTNGQAAELAGYLVHKRLTDDPDSASLQDLSNAARSTGTTTAIAADKLNVIHQRPTAIVKHEHHAEELMGRLNRLLNPNSAQPSIESTADELPATTPNPPA